MSFLKKITSALGGGLLKQATGLIDNLVTSDEERQKLKIELKKVVQEHEEAMHRLAHENTASAREMQQAALAQERPLLEAIDLLPGWPSGRSRASPTSFLATFTEVA